MQLEQQQRIMGYFIEEAKDHLNTIEQGLLNLQTTIEDPELLNEVFRAAHSVKGGAAMLGLNSIQQTAHRLEDSFKILKDNRLPTQSIDQQLESLFLQVFDTLQALIDQLSGPYGLTEEAASAILQDVEPVFEALNYHIKVVQQQGTKRSPEVETGAQSSVSNRPIPTPVISKESPSSAKDLVFRSDVPERLREMLQQFKQSETPKNRQELIETCRSLARAGELFDLPNWVKFIETIEKAIANPDNTYRSLVTVVIKSIKEAQELVLVNREIEIVVTEAITKLLPKAVTSPKTQKPKSQTPPHQTSAQSPRTQKSASQKSPPESGALEGQSKSRTSKKKSAKAPNLTNPLSDVNWSDSVTNPSNTPTRLHNGPEITTEEYNSLRDLFEGLDEWDQEVHEEVPSSTTPSTDAVTDPMAGDFFDLLGDISPPSPPTSTQAGNGEWAMGNENSSDCRLPIPDSPPSVDLDLGSFFDHLSDGDSGMPETGSRAEQVAQKQGVHDPVDSFGDLFDELLALPQEWVPPSGFVPTNPDQIVELLEDAENLDELFDQFDQQTQLTVETPNSGHLTQEINPVDWFEELLQSEMEEPVEVSTSITGNSKQATGNRVSQKSGVVVTAEPTLELPDDDFASLDDLLNQPEVNSQPATSETEDDDFLDLDKLLNSPEVEPPAPIVAPTLPITHLKSPPSEEDSEFIELIRLIEDAPPRSRTTTPPRGTFAKPIAEHIVKVPVKQLDGLSNLMGELVVNRNSLEQDQERMRQFLDNLLHQVSLLGDVGQRMQDFYERSLLEISLLSHRRKPFWFSESSSIHDDDSSEDLDSTELDRFTPFHTLSQEIIELIVRVRESSADIGFLVEEADQVTRELRRITTALQEGLNRARMEPFGSEADALKRPVRDISIKCGKQAELFVEGRDTLIDKMLLGKLHDPLIHLVNNAITHGIETEEVRTRAGKSAVGRISIRVFHQGNQTIIAVSDDGGGIDVNRVKDKAIQKGIITAELKP